MAASKKKSDGKDSRQRAREQFLQALERCAPEVRLSLAQEILPYYKKITELLARTTRVDLVPWPQHLSEMASLNYASEDDLRYLPVDLQPVLRFELALCDWARQWNLIDAWLFREVLATLMDWDRFPETDNWANIPHKRMVDMEFAFRFVYPPFDARIDTWTSYQQRLKAAFTNALAVYREKQNTNTRTAREHTSYHFDWLVEFQVNKLSYSDICKKYGRPHGTKTRLLDASAVYQAVHSTSALIGLTLRSVKRGRKANRSDAD